MTDATPPCPECGYDLSGTPGGGRCSECGLVLTPAVLRAARERRFLARLRRAVPVLGACAIVAAIVATGAAGDRALYILPILVFLVAPAAPAIIAAVAPGAD
jgi:hypothetical protein